MTKQKYTFDDLYKSAICPICKSELELHNVSTHVFNKVEGATGRTWEEVNEYTDEEYLHCDNCGFNFDRDTETIERITN